MRKSLLILALISIFALASCSTNKAVDGSSIFSQETSTTVQLTEQENGWKAQDNIAASNTRLSVQEDTDKGLSVTKIYAEKDHLSDFQQLMINYFDSDFFYISTEVDSMQRYPDIYKGAQVSFICNVIEVVESNSEAYKMLVDVCYSGEYLVIEGKQCSPRIIKGDTIYVTGTYTDIITLSINQTSYTVPSVYVNKWGYNISMESFARLFSDDEIKTIAKAFFGNNIKIRDFDNENDLYMGTYMFTPLYGYVVELDNQSNANFTQYYFSDTGGTSIVDLKSTDNIERKIEVAADFEHYILTVYNKNMQTLILEYYDNSLQKIWSTELSNINSYAMDYTRSHLYLSANGYLYIFDIDSGKESISKKYIGEKQDIRKLDDGILLIGLTGTDGIMKTDLEGNVIWSGNLVGSEIYMPTVQYVENRYVVYYRYYNDDNNGTCFSVYDNAGNEIQTVYVETYYDEYDYDFDDYYDDYDDYYYDDYYYDDYDYDYDYDYSSYGSIPWENMSIEYQDDYMNCLYLGSYDGEPCMAMATYRGGHDIEPQIITEIDDTTLFYFNGGMHMFYINWIDENTVEIVGDTCDVPVDGIYTKTRY